MVFQCHVIPNWGPFFQYISLVYVLTHALTFCCTAAQHLVVPNWQPFQQYLAYAIAFVTSCCNTILCLVGNHLEYVLALPCAIL